jgi:hypothetical protein
LAKILIMCPYHPAMLTLAHSVEPFALIHWSQVRMTHGFLNWHTSPTHALQCQSYHTTYDCKMILNRMIHQQHLKHPAVRFSGGITWLNLFRQFVWNSKSEKHMKRPRFGRNSDYINFKSEMRFFRNYDYTFSKSEILIPKTEISNQKFWFRFKKTNKWSPIRNYDSKPRILMPNEKKCSENFTWESETQMPTCHFHTIYVPTFKGGLKTATFKLLSIHFVKLHLGIRISDFLQKEFLIPSVVIFWLHHSEPGQMQIL